MTYLPNLDYYHEVSMGRVAGSLSVARFGFSTSAILNDPEDVWEFGGSIPRPTTAEVMNLSSTSASDTLLGTGARTVLIDGLDGNYERIQETVDMAGLTDAASTNSFIRVFDIISITAGSDGTNVGNITAVGDVSGDTYALMLADRGNSRNSNYTVPDNKRARIVYFSVTAKQIAGGQAPRVNLYLLFKPGIADASTVVGYETIIETSVAQIINEPIPVGGVMGAKEDVAVVFESDRDSQIETKMYIVEEDNDS